MATVEEDDKSNDSIFTTNGSFCTQIEQKSIDNSHKTDISVVKKLFNRQLFGRFTKNSRSKTERIYEKIPETCNRLLSEVLPEFDTASAMQNIYMGFTICGQYLLSYTWTTEEDLQSIQLFSVIYYLCVWRYAPGHRLNLVTKQKIFRHYRPQTLLDVSFSQWPTDKNKIVAYGVNLSHPSDAYITIFFLPSSQKCEDCLKAKTEDDITDQPPCLRHSITIDFMLNITTPFPVYNPIMHLAYPDHIVVNTGHYLHIINVSFIASQSCNSEFRLQDDLTSKTFFNDSISEISELSDILDTNKPNIVEAIIQDFSEYDLESNECAKPFHELNITCEPLLVTGKSYFNESKLKVFQNTASFLNISGGSSQNLPEKTKIDKNIAEKAYEFTEDNEKCEKLSSFRKKRLADKKYEFSEDNCENIVPFQLLRQERRFLLRNQSKIIRSPDYFMVRSPTSPRNLNYPAKHSPLSPSQYQSTKKFNLYSPSHIDTSDCSDFDSKFVLRQINNCGRSSDVFGERNSVFSGGLLAMKKCEDRPRWIRKMVKRYCNLDFDGASLVSDVQSRDDYLCIELPILVHTSLNTAIDAVPTRVSDDLIGPHLKVTQKTFDSEQFCQRRAEKLCTEQGMKFTHCEDYDIKIIHICPLSGDIICSAELKIGAVKHPNTVELSQAYTTSCLFIWNIATDDYRVLEGEGPTSAKLKLFDTRPSRNSASVQSVVLDDIPQVHCRKVRHMAHNMEKSLQFLRDSENYIQISIDKNDSGFLYHIEYGDPYQESFDELSDVDEIFD